MITKNIVGSEVRGNDLVLTRIFNAPRALVFKVWIDKKHVEQWWGPHFIKNNKIETDLRTGGAYRYTMSGPDGTDYPMKGIYTEVKTNERITYTCNLEEHPKNWHDQITNNLSDKNTSIDLTVTVTFEDVDNHQTKVSVITRFKSKEVLEAFAKMGMVQGWTESLEKFETEMNKSK